MKRVIVIDRDYCPEGKGVVIRASESLEDFISRLVSEVFVRNWNSKAKLRLFESNAEIADIDFIREDDVLVIDGGGCSGSDWLTLNVGGKIMMTSRSTITSKAPESMLAKMFGEIQGMNPSTRDRQGAYLIDRCPKYFEPILNYLRTGSLILDPSINPEGVLEEARYFGIGPLIPELEDIVQDNSLSPDSRPLSRRNVIDALLSTPTNRDLRFQGVNLSRADLSKLDLRHINFKYANLSHCRLLGANLSWCNLERADLSGAVMDGAQILGVKMLCANLEGASLKSCNFHDPAGSSAIMESVNLRGANLEGSYMSGVNLRVATLKNGNMKNCDLRGACLAGADLEFCNLSGSDLHEANLRGANLKDTTLELMLTPLHMSQTIR